MRRALRAAPALLLLASATTKAEPPVVTTRPQNSPAPSHEKTPPLDETAIGLAEASRNLPAAARLQTTRAALSIVLLSRFNRLLPASTSPAFLDELSAAFKAEKKRLGDTAEEEWLKDEEARLKALVEARVLGVRQHLVGIVAERTADVLRARHGLAGLQFPDLADESRQLAGQFEDAELLRVLDGAARLRLFLDRNVKEDVALEAGCLSLIRA